VILRTFESSNPRTMELKQLTRMKSDLKRRTREFAAKAILFSEALPDSKSGKVIANQMIRAASSVGANYRAATRAKSGRDMAVKLNIVLEEADEVQFWLELAVEIGLSGTDEIRMLHQEANEIVAIMVKSIQTIRSKSKESSKVRGLEDSIVQAHQNGTESGP
jgi:four helix bundle protein